jgi:CRP-like cAMP-binding protein
MTSQVKPVISHQTNTKLMFELLFQNFARHIELDEEEKEIIESLFQPKKYRKHQYLLQQGDISRFEIFVVSGLTRSYEIDDKGQEHVIQFGPEGWWIGDMYSYLSETPSSMSIDCIEDTSVLQISKKNQEILYVKVPKLERFFRILVQNAYMASISRISSTLSKPAWQRYNEFITRYPLIDQRVPNHQIASYLGVTPQSLSRIRRNFQKAEGFRP